MARRDKVSIRQRVTPCVCCDYPISQQHHLLPIAKYGETGVTIQLCANCHELYHFMYGVGTRTMPGMVTKFLQQSRLVGRNEHMCYALLRHPKSREQLLWMELFVEVVDNLLMAYESCSLEWIQEATDRVNGYIKEKRYA